MNCKVSKTAPIQGVNNNRKPYIRKITHGELFDTILSGKIRELKNMKYKCCKCKTIFDEDMAKTQSEYMGEFWGSPAYESYLVCPNCRTEEIEEYKEEEND